MSDHKHEWITQFYSFDSIEHDEPYEVLYCACGERKTKKMTAELEEEVREFNALPSEDIQGGE